MQREVGGTRLRTWKSQSRPGIRRLIVGARERIEWSSLSTCCRHCRGCSDGTRMIFELFPYEAIVPFETLEVETDPSSRAAIQNRIETFDNAFFARHDGSGNFFVMHEHAAKILLRLLQGFDTRRCARRMRD